MNATAKTVIVGLLLTPALALAQAKGSGKQAPAAASHAAVVQSLPKGSAFTSGGRHYRFLGGARAVARGGGETETQALARAGAAPDDLLERKGGFLVFRDARVAASAAPQGGAGAYPVAVNARTGQVGVVSGILNARLKKGADPAAIAEAHGVALVSSAPRIRAAFFRVPMRQDLQAAAAAIAKDAKVASAEIEVLEHIDVVQ